MIDRRKFLHGVLSLFAGPAIVRSGLIMPVKAVILPPPLYFGELNLDEGRDVAYWLDQFEKVSGLPRRMLLASNATLPDLKVPTIFSPTAATRH